MIEGNPIPHILKDLENWSANDLALLITYLNRGVYEQFLHKVLHATPEEFERLWPVYKQMKAEIVLTQSSLMAMEKYVDHRLYDAERHAMHKSLRAPVSVIIDADEQQRNRFSLREDK